MAGHRLSGVPIVPVLSIACVATTALVVLSPGPAAWAAAAGVYPDWQRGGSSGSWTVGGSVDAAGFPLARATSNASTLTTPSGASAFLGSDTAFGQTFGSSQGQPYVNVSTAAGLGPSATKLSFVAPTPSAGWGFALGDVDADAVQVSAVDAHGGAVSAADLGFKSSFNYCVNTPKPSSCTGSGPFTDAPVWDPSTSTLKGNGLDTFGASGWFAPTVAITSLTLTFTKQTGSPIFQLWLATLAVPLTGTVDGLTPADPPAAPGVVLDLEHSDHSPVVDPAGDPVTAKADPQGAFDFPAVVDGDYRIAVDPPPGTRDTGAASAAITVDVSAGAARVPAGTFAVQVQPRSAPAPAPSGPSSQAAAASPRLPATGGFDARLALLSGLLVALGAGLRWAGRRRPAEER